MSDTPDAADIYAGSKMRLQRKILKISQSEVAKALGITFQQVQKYENGKNRISASRLSAIAGLLGVSVGFFFHDPLEPSGLNVGSPAGNVTEFIKSSEGLALNRAFMEIKNQNVRRDFIALVTAISEAGNVAGASVASKRPAA